LKKNEDVSMLALREFTKLLKDKKLSRFVSKASIESIPVKAVGRVEKIMQQVELINANKKIDNENENNLKNGIIQFLSVSLVGSK
jgi:ethanolamine ammonia-lyase large subunit